MPDLRARETSLRHQAQALDAQLADREVYLKLAENLEGFLAALRTSAATATVEDRQRVVRLLVKEVLVGPSKIVIRHSSPPEATHPHPPLPARTVTTTRSLTEVRTCVGGVLSPLMCNVYLHRLDRAWDEHDGVLVRFADDLVVMCWSAARLSGRWNA